MRMPALFDNGFSILFLNDGFCMTMISVLASEYQPKSTVTIFDVDEFIDIVAKASFQDHFFDFILLPT